MAAAPPLAAIRSSPSFSRPSPLLRCGIDPALLPAPRPAPAPLAPPRPVQRSRSEPRRRLSDKKLLLSLALSSVSWLKCQAASYIILRENKEY
ncbi:hypothetical protein PVAP13_4NG263911 [Panicum virgatum]|uniref:Uncharacterized protein n=1 Tax=Panicum virgatum TaxID=38727 RepID=A0A8T0TG94_PANVG|nr:hypothetical protein PVAP13_4NG263911 [Panicum virgatum]